MNTAVVWQCFQQQTVSLILLLYFRFFSSSDILYTFFYINNFSKVCLYRRIVEFSFFCDFQHIIIYWTKILKFCTLSFSPSHSFSVRVCVCVSCFTRWTRTGFTMLRYRDDSRTTPKLALIDLPHSTTTCSLLSPFLQ